MKKKYDAYLPTFLLSMIHKNLKDILDFYFYIDKLIKSYRQVSCTVFLKLGV